MLESDAQNELTRKSFLRESAYHCVSSPLFSFLARACAGDADMVELCSATRRRGQSAMLLMFVAQYLLLKAPDPKLARYFPSLTDSPDPLQESFPAFREFCLDRRDEIQDLLSWRTVNTNLPEKASSLLPAIRYVDHLSEEPLTLVEICCSAGLNMLFDEYHYDYGPLGQLGVESSPVQLSCKAVGDGSPPLDTMPRVARRVGIDLVKVDPSAPLERLWMQAVLCPEWRLERQRLEAALSIRAQRELQIIIADALEALPSLLRDLPGSICILQSYCMGHWSEAAKSELEATLRNASRHRDIHRLAFDMADNEPPQTARDRLATLSRARIPILQKTAPSRIDHTWYSHGNVQTQLLGQGDIFGVWLYWQAQS